MEEPGAMLARWGLDTGEVRRRMYEAPSARERERWHAVWLVAQGLSASRAAALLERDPHTVGTWLGALAAGGPGALAFVQTGGSPPPSRRRRTAS
jgi:transposase